MHQEDFKYYIEHFSEDHIISFNTAVLAKAKGFDSIDKYCYDPECHDVNHIYVWCQERQCSTEGRMKRLVSAPCQSLLQRWLREKHSEVICIDYNEFKGDEGLNWTWRLPHHPLNIGDYYSTYEEALEEGLRRALNLLLLS